MSSNSLLKHFLGRSKNEIHEILGPPVMAWMFRHRNVLIYEIDGASVTFTMREGRVNNIDQLAERRFNRRLQPTEKTRVIIRTGNSIFEGIIDDVSERSIAITISDMQNFPDDHTSVTICTHLHTSRLIKKCIILEGEIHSHRNLAGQKKAIIIFNQTETHSHQILREFINYHLAILALKGHVSLPSCTLSESITIKSDRCGSCSDQICEKE